MKRTLGGRYELGPMIGTGGLADVYLADDTRLHRVVAVKFLRCDLARDPAFITRFNKEALSVAADGLGFSPLEVALAWVRDNPLVTSSIVGARTGAQMKGILTSEEIVLPAQIRAVLNEVSAVL